MSSPVRGVAERIHRLELAGLLAWVSKDLGWVLLFPVLSFAAALVALCLESYTLSVRWTCQGRAELVHGVAVLLWLCGNIVWMVTEALYDTATGSGRHMPWAPGPLLGARRDSELLGNHIAQGFFLAGIATLFILYFSCAVQLWLGDKVATRAREDQQPDGGGARKQKLVAGIVTPQVYKWVFIGPWIVKDFFWTLQLFSCSVLFALLAGVFVVECTWRFGDAEHIAELVWMVACFFWVFGETELDDAFLWPRWLAGALLLADAFFMAFALWRAVRSSGQISEDSYLFGSPACTNCSKDG